MVQARPRGEPGFGVIAILVQTIEGYDGAWNALKTLPRNRALRLNTAPAFGGADHG